MTDSTPAQECERCAQLGLQSPAVHTVNGLKLCETCAAAGVLNVMEAIDEAIEPVREADDPSARAEACAALARTCQKVADGLERSIANAAQGKVSAPVLPEPLERLANRVDTGLDLAHVAVKNLRDAAMPRCRDAAMPRCRDAAMPRCRDAAMPRSRGRSRSKTRAMKCSESTTPG